MRWSSGRNRDHKDKGQKQKEDNSRGNPGWKDCGRCGGTGKELKERGEVDEDGVFSGTQELDCSACGGTGKLPIR